MPIRNEAEHLERAVDSILAQDYPLSFDVCLAVAASDDGTETVAADLASRETRVTVVSNPAGVTPAGLNAAIAATTGEVVVRVDGHSALSEGYIRRAVETMRRTGAVNVGGIQDAKGETPFEEAVAAAMTSWLGTGGSRFHVGGAEGSVDTVYLGVFDRAAGDTVGWFDERLIRNQDYELNIRLRKAGGTIWFDPELSVSYRPRGSFRALAKQYYEYGFWKAEVLQIHPDSLKARQAVPSLVPTALVGSLLLSRRHRGFRPLPLVYFAIVLATSRSASRRRNAHPVCVPGAIVVMHHAWGLGALHGFTKSLRSAKAL
jgi:succinoglycan biosynthesis protein ExoA